MYKRVALLVAVASTPLLAHAVEGNTWRPADDNLRILEMRVGQYRLDDVLATYQYQDSLLIPLGALADSLDIAIDVRPGVAQGFVFNQEKTFFLDTSRKQIILGGVAGSYAEELVQFLDDDIYVESRLLSSWLGFNLEPDLYASTIWIRSDTPLPFQVKIEREKRIAKTLARFNVKDREYPQHYEPYNDISVPFIDQTIESNYRNNSNGTTSTLSYTTYASADLLYHEASLYLVGNDADTVMDARLTLGRKDPEAALLGPAHATEYAVGHVTEPRVDLVTIPGQQEAGAVISNYPLNRQQEFDRHRFRGDLLPGWEIELYRNDALIAYQASPVNGQYDFQDIPLLFGTNYFRLVFYGPQGEIREEEQRFELGQSLTSPGKHYYRALVTNDDLDGNRSLLQYDVGFSKQYSGNFNFVSVPLQNGLAIEQHNYLNAGLQGFWKNYFITFDTYKDAESGSAYEIGAQTRIDSISIGLKNTRLSDFFSEEFTLNEAAINQRTTMRLDSALPSGLLPRIPVSIEYITEKFSNNTTRNQLTNLLSTNVHGLSISNQLIYVATTNLETVLNGSLQLSQHYTDISTRATLNYNFKPESELNDLNITLDAPQLSDYRISYGLTQSFVLKRSELGIQATKPIGNYSLSIGARYNTDDEFSIDARFSIALGREPRTQQWHSTARSMATHGSVSARVFMDTDMDGVYSDDEQGISDINFRVNNGYNAAHTDSAGIAFITGLREHQPVNLTLADGSLTDPSWSAAIEGVRITPRPGQTIELDFPILVTGEIDGTVRLEKSGKLIGAGSVTVELVDEQGRIIKTVNTEYDGYYTMSNVLPGTYRVQIASAQTTQLGLKVTAPARFTIDADTLYANGLDFRLR